jgi:hypothetical protein
VVDLEGETGSPKPTHPPFSPQIYYKMLVKLKILRPQIHDFFLLFDGWVPPPPFRSRPPFSKFLDPPLSNQSFKYLFSESKAIVVSNCQDVISASPMGATSASLLDHLLLYSYKAGRIQTFVNDKKNILLWNSTRRFYMTVYYRKLLSSICWFHIP